MASSRRTGTNENIQSYGGVTRDFTIFSVWEAATDIDLVAGAQSEVLECFDDAASFDDTINASGATTNTSFFRMIRPGPGQGHDGTSNNGFTIASTAADHVFTLSEANFQVQDIIATMTYNSASTRNVFRANGDSVILVGCIAFDGSNSGSGSSSGFNFTASSDNSRAILCLAENNDSRGFLMDAGSSNALLYNCTAIGNAVQGIDVNESTCVVTNCLSSSNPADFTGAVGAGSTTNASSDATAPGTSPRINQTFTFVNAAGNDYHLSQDDAGAKDFGTDLSTDAMFAFNDDIDGNKRPLVWDIGVDEVGGGGGPSGGVKRRRRLLFHRGR